MIDIYHFEEFEILGTDSQYPSFRNIEKMFDIVNVHPQCEAMYLDEVDLCQYCWVNFNDEYSEYSLIYLPSPYGTIYELPTVTGTWDENGKTYITRKTTGVKVVTSLGKVCTVPDVFLNNNIFEVTISDLRWYKKLVATSEKYQKPTHRFIDVAISKYEKIQKKNIISLRS